MFKYIITVVLAVCLGYFSYDYGYKTAYNKQASTYLKQIEEQQIKYKALQNKLIIVEQDKQNEIKAINLKHDAIVSSLRNRPNRTASTESNNSTTICPRAGSTGEQLFREDAEFLIGEASKAMILRESLASCRRYLLETNQ